MRLRLGKVAIVALAVIALSGGAVSASTLDFSAFPSGYYPGTTVIVLSNATVTSYGTDFYINSALGYDFCAIVGGTCEADAKIDFNNSISNLTLQTYGWAEGDFVDLLAYDGAHNLIGSVLNIASNGVVTGLSGLVGIRTLYFDEHSTAAGIGYGSFSFTESGTAVPDPGSSLLLLGMGLVGLRAWRKRQ
jgi:hypothetical protein